GGDAAAFVRAQFAAIPTQYEVEVILHAAAADLDQAAARWGKIEAIDDTSCRLRMSVDTFDWPTLLLTALEVDFDVVGPPEFRDYLRATGERFLRARQR
ncbi:MAG TPA: WYL domain-containing protein, partial [Euzebyales bacterium]|nr:WYL domain-containing protein [Euzebyales bacterium]